MICELILLVFCAIKSYSEIHAAKMVLFLEEPVLVMNKIHKYMNLKNAVDEKQPTSMTTVQLIFAPRIKQYTSDSSSFIILAVLCNASK